MQADAATKRGPSGQKAEGEIAGKFCDFALIFFGRVR
jgi:hypothetical protein